MAVTVSSFKVQYPEFANADTALLQATLDDAVKLCPAVPWGDKQDMGVMRQTAALLARSPFARGMELQMVNDRTVYEIDLERLRRIVCVGVRVIGGC